MPSPSPPPKKTTVKTKKRSKPATRRSERKKSREILPPPHPTSEDSFVDEEDDKDEAYVAEINEDTNEATSPQAKKKKSSSTISSVQSNNDRNVSKDLFYKNFKNKYANTKRILLKYPTSNDIKIYIQVLKGVAPSSKKDRAIYEESKAMVRRKYKLLKKPDTDMSILVSRVKSASLLIVAYEDLFEVLYKSFQDHDHVLKSVQDDLDKSSCTLFRT